MIGFGMQLGFSTTSNGTVTGLVALTDINPQGITIEKADAIHHGLTNPVGATTPGIIQFSELEATVEWSKTEYPTLLSQKRVQLFWTVTYPEGSKDLFPGYITEIKPATPLKERMTCQLKIQPTDLSTFTPAA